MNLPPVAKSIAREVFMSLGRIGERALAAGANVALESAGKLTEEVTARLKRAAAGAAGISRGEPYKRDERRRQKDVFWPEEETVGRNYDEETED